jgi:hypothetical protein
MRVVRGASVGFDLVRRAPEAFLALARRAALAAPHASGRRALVDAGVVVVGHVVEHGALAEAAARTRRLSTSRRDASAVAALTGAVQVVAAGRVRAFDERLRSPRSSAPATSQRRARTPHCGTCSRRSISRTSCCPSSKRRSQRRRSLPAVLRPEHGERAAWRGARTRTGDESKVAAPRAPVSVVHALEEPR